MSSAFEHGAAKTGSWLAARLAQMEHLPRTPAAALFMAERVIVEWTGEARPLALIYQEHQAVQAGVVWPQVWQAFWLEAAETFGLSPQQGRLLHVFFESEALYHLSAWSPALEAAALRELCGRFGDLWLGAGAGAPIGALALAEAAAGARPALAVAPMEARLAQAAADVVEARGLAGLTHRAVAARAGVTTGAVTHYFRTVESLVAGAIQGQVLTMFGPERLALSPGDIGSAEEFLEAARQTAVAPPPVDPGGRRRLLFLASVRRPDLAAAGAVIRFAHGGTARQVLARLAPTLPAPLDPMEVSLDAGLLSRLMAALRFASAADDDPAAAQADLAAAIGDGLARRWLGRI